MGGSAANLWWGVLFGAIGSGFLIYGKKQRSIVPMLCGGAMAVYPFFVESVWLTVVLGIALTVIPFVYRP